MWLRAQQFRALDEPENFAGLVEHSTTAVELIDVFDESAIFVAGLLVPECKVSYEYTDAGLIRTVRLLAVDSWAAVTSATGEVRQLGARRLWDEVESAYEWWREVGRPSYDRFGVTVTREGQSIWLDHPGNVLING
jgi:hypothetical protein